MGTQLVQIASGRPALLPVLTQEDIHLFETDGRHFGFVVDGSRLYQIAEETAALLQSDSGPSVLARFALQSGNRIADDAPQSMQIRSLSLAVAQKCNLSCTYCYAQEGSFGSEPKQMSREAAQQALDFLFSGAEPGQKVMLAFMGGEPMLNRALVRECVEYASKLAETAAVNVEFSITTNGTLLVPDDAEFFEKHGFSVTVSLDGIEDKHDRLRPFRGGQGSYKQIIAKVHPFLTMQRRMQVSARVTVTPENLSLRETMDALLKLGFHSVGFSPMLHAPSARGEMAADELGEMLRQMTECGNEFERRLINGQRYPFSNVVTALQQIHKGTHRPYPCGAGAGYLGVSAEGKLYACHRFVAEEEAEFGDVWNGVDRDIQRQWLHQRHVHRQEPCSKCWARYLCGGGCHHEAIHRGRPACDYIRGWLDYCLKLYARVSHAVPGYFAVP